MFSFLPMILPFPNYFIFVRTKTFHHQTIMLSFVCDYSEGDRPSAPWLSEPPNNRLLATRCRRWR